MEGYLGETKIDISKTEYAQYSQIDWALFWMKEYSFEGENHKRWLLDQVARILTGTKVNMKIAKWKNGKTEERFYLDTPPAKYHKWVEEYKNGEDGEDTYSYDVGIAP